MQRIPERLLLILVLAGFFSCEVPDSQTSTEPANKTSENTLSELPSDKSVSIGFYNVENLFDTQDDPKTFDDDFTPNGELHWTDGNYATNLRIWQRSSQHWMWISWVWQK